MKSMLVAGCLLLSPVAFADAELRYRIEGSCPTQFDVVQVSGSQVRIDMRATETNMTALFDGSEDLVTYLMHDQHRYLYRQADAEDAGDAAAAMRAGTQWSSRRCLRQHARHETDDADAACRRATESRTTRDRSPGDGRGRRLQRRRTLGKWRPRAGGMPCRSGHVGDRRARSSRLGARHQGDAALR